jgi:hypothetical protein
MDASGLEGANGGVLSGALSATSAVLTDGSAVMGEDDRI